MGAGIPVGVHILWTVKSGLAFMQFQLQGAHTLCSQFLHDHMNDASCIDTLFLAETYELEHLGKAAEEYALSRFQQVSERENFKDLTCTLLERLLGKDELRADSEVSLLTN